jgi:hypothetical protein
VGAWNSATGCDLGFPVQRTTTTRDRQDSGSVALRLIYLIFIRLLGAIALLLRSDVSKEAEILLLRLCRAKLVARPLIWTFT